MPNRFEMRKLFGFALAILMFSSCNGIFSGIYDKPVEAADPFGFVEANADGTGTIFIDAREYKHWVYINLKGKKTETHDMTEGLPEPEHWDFAVHRYDVKTNDAKAAVTNYTELSQVLNQGIPESAVFVADTASQVAVDMSGMMEGNIVYQSSPINKVLSKWINVDTSTMPPIYTMSRRVYLLRLADGTQAALLFSDFIDDAGVKGFITIKYVYPLK